MTLEDKAQHLREITSEMDGLVVAFSGGVDSTLLLAVAREALGDRVVAGTIRSALNPPEELRLAEETAARLGVPHEVLDVDVLGCGAIAQNAPDRCYHCKRQVFAALRELADRRGLCCIAHGEHAGDLAQHRPGHRAAEELGVRAPLAEAGMEKADIRELSKRLGLEGWDRPAMACLASRIPYGIPLSAEVLHRVAEAERVLRSTGVRQGRVRHHGELARIEVAAEDLPRASDPEWRRRLVAGIKQAGYVYVTLDLEGFRSGSMDEVLGSREGE